MPAQLPGNPKAKMVVPDPARMNCLAPAITVTGAAKTAAPV
jgi:hypothetical protein